jgi:NAD(P)-dependent dehydrogenase (short-subunit alcohol dehydrogenase family)
LLRDKVVLVSGGTQGVGAGIARAAVREGASVVVTGRRRDVGAAFARAAGVTYVPADVADVTAARASVTATVERFGRVDCLVNAAGLTSRGTLLDTTPELFDAHIAVNLRGPFFLMQAVVADMLRRRAAGTMAGLTRNAAHAHRFDRIRINGVDIGWTDTEGEDAVQRRFHDAGDDWREQAGKGLPMGRLARVDEIADFVVFLLSERSGVVTGSVIDWDQNVVGGTD